MKSETWDIVTQNPHGTDSLWAGLCVARRLAELGCRARLFVDSAADLARYNLFADPEAWVQQVESFELVLNKVASNSQPSRTVVQMFDAALPPGYRDRLFTGAAQRDLIRIHALSQTVKGVAPTSHNSSSVRFWDLIQGAHEDGFVKPPLDQEVVFARWSQSKVARKLTLESLRIPCHDQAPAPVARTVLLAGLRAGGPARVLQALGQAGTPLRVLLASPDEYSQVDAAAPPVAALAQPLHPLELTALPDVQAHMLDQAVWISDVVLTESEEIALCAARVGIPVLWASSKCEAFAHWYAQAMPGHLAALYLQVAHGFRYGEPVELKLALARLPELAGEARRVRDEIRGAANVADIAFERTQSAFLAA
jgi:hypothetical protein